MKRVIVAGAPPPTPDAVVLRLSRCRSLLGADVSANEVRDALFRLGLAPAAENEDAVEWKIPSHRRDLSREVDLIEEVARVIGIEKVRSRIAAAPAPPSEADDVYDFQTTVRQQLYALGLSEARTSTLVSERMLWRDETPLRLRNPLGRRPGVSAHKPPSWLDCGFGTQHSAWRTVHRALRNRPNIPRRCMRRTGNAGLFPLWRNYPQKLAWG